MQYHFFVLKNNLLHQTELQKLSISNETTGFEENVHGTKTQKMKIPDEELWLFLPCRESRNQLKQYSIILRKAIILKNIYLVQYSWRN